MSIEKAAEAMAEADGVAFNRITVFAQQAYRNRARAALPHLMKEPTLGESCTLALDLQWSNIDAEKVHDLLTEFVRRRNAPPEPPKARTAATIAAILLRRLDTHTFIVDQVAEEIIEAMAIPAAPPEPDPRREAALLIEAALAQNPPQNSAERREMAYRILSALDSLKEGQR